MDRIWNYSCQKSHLYLVDIKSSPSLTRRGWIWYGQNNNTKYVFHQSEFVNNFDLKAQNLRRDTSIPRVSEGLVNPSLILTLAYFVALYL